MPILFLHMDRSIRNRYLSRLNGSSEQKEKTIMNVLVTGAGGFIGSTLAERLIENGHHVTGIDNFTPYYSPLIKHCNLDAFVSSPQFTLFETSIAAIDEKVLENIEVVFHLAGQPGVRSSFGEGFTDYLAHNIAATQSLLEKLKNAPNIKRLVFASSSSVYGETSLFKLKENMLPKPVSPYGVTKLAAEQLCNLYSKLYGYSFVGLRYFTVYGPRQRPDMAIHKFFRALLNGEPITLFGDGSQMRDFTFVDDAVSATVAAGTAEIPGRTVIINIGSGTSITLRRVLECMSELTGKMLNITYGQPENGDMARTHADIERAGKILGYKPAILPYEGLSREYEWFRANAHLLKHGRRGPEPLMREASMV